MSIEPIRFSHRGRDLEVRAMRTPNGWKARVFEGTTKVTRVFYTVSYDTDLDAEFQGIDIVGELMQIAQSDVESDLVQLLDP